MDLPALERPHAHGDNQGWKPPQMPYEPPMSFSQPAPAAAAASSSSSASASASAYPPSLSVSAPLRRPNAKELASLCLRLELSGVLSDRPVRERVALLQANDWALERAVESFFREEQARAEEEEEELFNEVEEKSNGSGGVKEEPNTGAGPASASAAAASSSSQAAAAFVTPARVNITVTSDSGESQQYVDVNSAKTLAKLMENFTQHVRRRCEFLFRGKLITESDTPVALGMGKSETVAARAPTRAKRAFQVPGGGAEPSAAMVAAAESLKAAAAASSNGSPSTDPLSKRVKSELGSSPGSAAAAAAAASVTAVPPIPAFRASWGELQLGSLDFWILQNRAATIDDKGNHSKCPPTMLALSSFVREFKTQQWSDVIRRRSADVVRAEAEAIGADVVESQRSAEEETRAKQIENSAIVSMLRPLAMHSQSLRGHVMLIDSIPGCECGKRECRQVRDFTCHQMRLTVALLPGAHDDIIPFGNQLLPLVCPELAPLIEAALPSGQTHPPRAQLHTLLDLSLRTRFKHEPEPRPDPNSFLMEVEDAVEDEEEKKIEPPAAAAAAAASSSSSAAAAAPAAPAVHLSEFDRLRSEWGMPLDPPEEDLSGPTTDALLALSDRELSARCKLACTLRDYQQQTVLWALKQETGVRSMADAYWVHVEIGKQTVWYSPFMQAIRFLPPPEVHGGLISEEMGLGKTVEMLALIHLNPATRSAASMSLGSPLPPHSASRPAGLVSAGSTLIIAPTSLVGQWYGEIETRSAGEKLKVLCWYGSSRTQDVNKIVQYDVVLTTFGIVAAELQKQNKKNAAAAAAAASADAMNGDDGSSSSADPAGPAELSPLHRIDWHRIIVDESHSLKSRHSKQSRNVMTLQSPRKWLLSGTPINLQIDDLFHQFLFFGMPVFNDAPILNMVRYHAFGLKHEARVDEFRPLEAFGLLRQMMQRTVMRHKKTQKFNGRPELIMLPPRRMDTIKIEFTPEERAGYDKMFEFARNRFQELPSNRRSFQILSLLLPVRQACSAGHHDLNEILESLKAIAQREEEGRIAAAEAKDASLKLNLAQQAFNDGECSICLDIIEDALMTLCRHQFCRECILRVASKPGQHECPLCRQQFTKKDLIKPAPRMEIKSAEELSKEAAAAAAAAASSSSSLASVPSQLFFSSKVDALMVQLHRLRSKDPSKKSLVFSQFDKTLSIVQERLAKDGFQCAVIKGNMTAVQRKNALDHFINDPHCTVFVMSIRAGSVGLTLTSATEVFVLEPSMNPALTQQAINRVHRVGQTKPVNIHHLIMAKSVEEKIMQLTQTQLTQRGHEEDNEAVGARGLLLKDTSHMRGEQLLALFA